MKKTNYHIPKIFKVGIDSNRIYGLDILRAFAVLVVVIGHGGDIISKEMERIIFLIIPDGVSIFFVLSGFLIGGLLIKILERERATVKVLLNFWQRRWLRTLPLYYCILLILVLLSYFFAPGFSIGSTKRFFVFCQNLDKSHSTFFTVSWSLSVEEWFYLLIPAIILVLHIVFKFTPRMAILLTASLVVVMIIGIRYYRYLTIHVKDVETFDILFRRPVITRLDSLMFGVIGAWMFYYRTAFWNKYKHALFISGVILHFAIKVSTGLFLGKSAFYYCNFSFPAEAFATLLLLPFLNNVKNGKGTIYKIITYISLISYSIYLIHLQLIKAWVLVYLPLPALNDTGIVAIKYLLYWVLTIAVSILSYKFIERYFMKWRTVKSSH